MKKILLLFMAILPAWVSWSQSESITYKVYINGKPADLKLYANIIHAPDSVEIRILDSTGGRYSTSGFTAKYFSLKKGKEQRQEMLFKKDFTRKFKSSGKITFKVSELKAAEDSYKIEIVLNTISFWDSKTKKWIDLAIHPLKRTFVFLLYP